MNDLLLQQLAASTLTRGINFVGCPSACLYAHGSKVKLKGQGHCAQMASHDCEQNVSQYLKIFGHLETWIGIKSSALSRLRSYLQK